ncbi:homoserine kinase [Striga asiatica]|uniref:Homoserine kinase n=1 Tax=Striga asiatica TaxID=4170 RepID=A0A5A7QEF3_STRAF|nr:homoserine kinase [Striga asiatica]
MQLGFSDLRLLPARTRLSTLLRVKYIVVTTQLVGDFPIDGSQVTHPDVLLNYVSWCTASRSSLITLSKATVASLFLHHHRRRRPLMGSQKEKKPFFPRRG